MKTTKKHQKQKSQTGNKLGYANAMMDTIYAILTSFLGGYPMLA